MRTSLLLILALTLSAQNTSSSVAAVVTAFHTAVKSGNAAAAEKLLAADAIFMESGGIETRQQYVTGHLPEDIKFEKAVTSSWKQFSLTMQGDVAWATSTEDITGTFEDRPVNLAVVELMVLSRQNGVWTIRSVSWSSKRR